jgi:hypothetical protein
VLDRRADEIPWLKSLVREADGGIKPGVSEANPG